VTRTINAQHSPAFDQGFSFDRLASPGGSPKFATPVGKEGCALLVTLHDWGRISADEHLGTLLLP